ncbi:MAG: T9SS type A sorting domain-containing protein [Saprospiraceae bacterium]|nr:T9SS type A sorting domain-containing protein [Saprospiraceae bacterium]
MIINLDFFLSQSNQFLLPSKKSYLLLSFGLFYMPSLISQEVDTTIFAPIGAIWSAAYNSDHMTATRDTFILGHNARVLEKFWTCKSFWSPDMPCNEQGLTLWNTAVLREEIIYTQGSQVYHFLEDSFYLLYDFNLTPGSTMVIHTRDRLHSTLIVPFQIYIDAVDTVNIDNHQLRAYHIREYDTDPSFYRFTGWVTERFGKEFYPFPFNNQDEDIFGFPFVASCYEDFEVQNATSDGCVLSFNETNYVPVGLYPNPANSMVNISIDPSFTNLKKIHIIDLFGKKHLSANINGNSTSQLFIEALPSGYYFVQADGASTSVPLIITHH